MFKRIFRVALIAGFTTNMALADSGSSACLVQVRTHADIDVQCFVDTQAYDQYSTGWCSNVVGPSNSAAFRLKAPSGSVSNRLAQFGITFQGWTPNCDWTAGSGPLSDKECVKYFSGGNQITMNANFYDSVSGTSCSLDITALAERDFGDF